MKATAVAVLAVATMILVGATVAAPAPEQHSTRPKPHKAKARTPVRLPNLKAEAHTMWMVERSTLRANLTKTRYTLAFWRHRGLWLRATRTEKCAQVPWQRSCTIARANYRLHTMLQKIALRRLKYELPNTNDWVTAVRIVQRPYPGTEERLLRITDHEGGRGEWVWWRHRPWTGCHIGADPWGDDTVGGPLQFRYSTFIGYWPGMVKDMKRRGYIIPDLGWARPYVVYGACTGYGPWVSMLGQALTGAYMHYYGKQGRHWNF